MLNVSVCSEVCNPYNASEQLFIEPSIFLGFFWLVNNSSLDCLGWRLLTSTKDESDRVHHLPPYTVLRRKKNLASKF